MNLLDKLHDKALNAKKKHVKYPLLVLSGIVDWFAGTYDEINGHGTAAQASEEEKDYKLYENGVKGAALGEVGAYAATVYTGSKAALVLAADILVRELNAIISVHKSTKRLKEDPDSGLGIDWDLTGAIGTVRTLAYKLGGRFGRSDAEPEEPIDYEDMEDIPPVFSDPFPDPLGDDEMRIMEEPEEDVSETLEGDDLLPTDFDPEPSLDPVELPGPDLEPFDPEPVKLPGPDEGYELPDILEPEDEPDAEYLSPDISDVELAADEPLDDDAPETSKPVIDIGPLAPSYRGPEAEQEDDDEDPLGFVEEKDSGNEWF